MLLEAAILTLTNIASQPMSFARHRSVFMDVSANNDSCTISAIPYVSRNMLFEAGIWPILSISDYKILAHAFRTSWINCCNVLFSGLTMFGRAMFDIIRSAPMSLPIPDQTRFILRLLGRGESGWNYIETPVVWASHHKAQQRLGSFLHLITSYTPPYQLCSLDASYWTVHTIRAEELTENLISMLSDVVKFWIEWFSMSRKYQ